jgi:hypothetical protein
MNNRTLSDINSDLDKFYNIVRDMKDHRPRLYDTTLKFPAWRGTQKNSEKTNGRGMQVEDYATAVLADLAKFSAHAAMLNYPASALSEVTHKKNLVDISKRFTQYLKIYTASARNIKDQQFCQVLINDMNNIEKTLQKFVKNPGPAQDHSRGPR